MLRAMLEKQALAMTRRGPPRAALMVPFRIGWWAVWIIWAWFHLLIQSMVGIWHLANHTDNDLKGQVLAGDAIDYDEAFRKWVLHNKLYCWDLLNDKIWLLIVEPHLKPQPDPSKAKMAFRWETTWHVCWGYNIIQSGQMLVHALQVWAQLQRMFWSSTQTILPSKWGLTAALLRIPALKQFWQ